MNGPDRARLPARTDVSDQSTLGAETSTNLPDASSRVLKEVIIYIQRMMSSDHSLQRTMKEIGEDIGYSVATVHRALVRLEAGGTIRIDKSTLPHTLVFQGDPTRVREDLEITTAEILRDMEKMAQRLRDHIVALTEQNEAMRKQTKVLQGPSDEWRNLKSRLVHEEFDPRHKELKLVFSFDMDPGSYRRDGV